MCMAAAQPITVDVIPATQSNAASAPAAALHPFERAGLGIAPFGLVGFFEKVYVACPGSPAQAGGSCDYCGTGIRYCCAIRSHDGREFIVGTDCVMKLNRADNKFVSEVERHVKALAKAARDKKNAEKKVREERRIAQAFEFLAKNAELRDRMAAQPHPMMKGDEHTLLSYIEYLRDRAGHSGRFRAAFIIEKNTK